jgi:cell wall-associated NlpC family hydrolase
MTPKNPASQKKAITEFLREAEACLHIPYQWGGNNPLQGLDCSGFVCWCLKSVGLLAFPDDLSAQALYNRFALALAVPRPESISAGCLLFFGDGPQEIQHVAIAVSPTRMIEAGGGASATTDRAMASRQGAMVRRVMIARRRDLVDWRLPEYPEP